jgi:hypothetical protein
MKINSLPSIFYKDKMVRLTLVNNSYQKIDESLFSFSRIQ